MVPIPYRTMTLWSLTVILTAALGCGRQTTLQSPPPPQTIITVAAAANLKFAFDELKVAFEQQYPNVELKLTYGASGTFFAQLSQQAPFDLFFSADTNYPRQLVARGLADEASYFLYARGRIAVWVPDASPLDLQAQGIRALVDPAVRKIAIANPRLAPYGAAAEQAMQEFGVYDDAKDRLVFGENITQTAQFIEFGAADVGIISVSLTLAPSMRSRGRAWEIPSTAYPPIMQAGIIPLSSKHRETAHALRAFVQGAEGQAILARFGYAPPKDSA